MYLDVHVTDDGIDGSRSGLADRSSHLLVGIDRDRIDEIDSCLSRALDNWKWHPDPERGPKPPYTLLAPMCTQER